MAKIELVVWAAMLPLIGVGIYGLRDDTKKLKDERNNCYNGSDSAPKYTALVKRGFAIGFCAGIAFVGIANSIISLLA